METFLNIRDGVVDAAIIGENVLIEKGNDIEFVERLGFSKCKVSIAVPKNATANALKDLDGKRIATSYPNTVNKYLAANNTIHYIELDGTVTILNHVKEPAYKPSGTKADQKYYNDNESRLFDQDPDPTPDEPYDTYWDNH